MDDKTFQCDLITPQRVLFSGRVVSVRAPGTIGNFQVLYNHAPLLSSLTIGKIIIRLPDGSELLYAISGGFAEVRENRVLLLAETAERRDEIDVARAEAARDRALKRLKERSKDIDPERARAALKRALNRLQIARGG